MKFHYTTLSLAFAYLNAQETTPCSSSASTVPTNQVIPLPPVTCLNPHTVLAGESLSSIAADNNVALSSVEALNPQIAPNFALIFISQIVCVGTPPCPKSCANERTIVAGDNLFALAKSTGISLDSIKKLNPQLSSNYSLIVTGQKICVGPGFPACPDSCANKHTIVAGDNLFALATSTGISLDSIKMLNPQLGPNYSLIFAGQVVCVGPPTLSSSIVRPPSATPVLDILTTQNVLPTNQAVTPAGGYPQTPEQDTVPDAQSTTSSDEYLQTPTQDVVPDEPTSATADGNPQTQTPESYPDSEATSLSDEYTSTPTLDIPGIQTTTSSVSAATQVAGGYPGITMAPASATSAASQVNVPVQGGYPQQTQSVVADNEIRPTPDAYNSLPKSSKLSNSEQKPKRKCKKHDKKPQPKY